MSDKLTAVLDEVIREGTFSAEALKKAKDLHEHVEKLERHNTSMEHDRQSAARRISELEVRVDELTKKNSAWHARDGELTKREATMIALEQRVAVAEAKAETCKEMAQLIFRNREVRRDIWSSSQSANYPGGESRATHGESETVT